MDDDILPFFVPAGGLLLCVNGLWVLLSTADKSRRPAPRGKSLPERLAEVRARVRKRILTRRAGGIFWFCLGAVTLAVSDFRAPWVLPSVSSFWMVLGPWVFFATFRRSHQAAITADVRLVSAATPAGSRRRLVRRLASGFSLCLGVTVLYLSDVRFGAAATALEQPREADNRLAEIVKEQVESNFTEQARVGLVVGAVAGKEDLLLGFGTCRLGDNERPDADTVFEIGSITKVFTGTLLAQRIEQGELQLDDRIAELLPDGWELSEPAREVTLRHCATHTSGFPRLPANLLSISGLSRTLFGGDPYRRYSEQQFREALAAVQLASEPGTEHLYSNFAAGLLGFVLATQEGTDYETLVKRDICQPLGMRRTTITNEPWHVERTPAKYRAVLRVGSSTVGLESSDWQIPNHLAGAGAIRSTGGDMMRFLKANMGLLSTPLDAAIRRSHQELYQQRNGRAMGMHWIRSFDAGMSQNIIWHNGGTGGFRSYLGFTEDRRVGVFVLSNTANEVDRLAREILTELVREDARSTRGPVVEGSYAKVAPYTAVRWDNGQPIVEVEGRWYTLVSIDGIPVDRIMHFARQEFGDKARKRFAEDLVELLATMGHEPKWEVSLGLQAPDGSVEQRGIIMTEENRRRVWERHRQ